MILLIIHRYLFWWISTFMESTKYVERWSSSHRGTPNIPNVRSLVYFDSRLIYRSYHSTKKDWCITQLSWQSSHGPNYCTSVDTLTLLEEPLSDTLILNTSRNSPVTDYYQVTARLLWSFISSLRFRSRRSFQINHYASLHHNARQPEWWL